MAHGFENLGRNTTFATRKEKAWHGLGSVVDSMTSKEAIILGGLDFEVGLAKLEARVDSLLQPNNTLGDIKSTELKKISTNFATYRKDTNDIFGVVGSRYEPIQNTEAFDFFDSIVGEGHATYETVGALGNGERVFITAKLPSKLIVNKDIIDQYLLLTMAHDGSGAIQVMFTPIRVVCNNTLSVALRSNKNKVSIRHTKNARQRLEKAKEVLGIIEYNSLALKSYYNHLSKIVVNDEQAKEYFKFCFNMKEQEDGEFSTRTQNKLNDIEKYYHTGVGQDDLQGTAWGVFNGITGYLQNGTDRTDEKQFINSFIKGDENIRQRFVQAIANTQW